MPIHRHLLDTFRFIEELTDVGICDKMHKNSFLFKTTGKQQENIKSTIEKKLKTFHRIPLSHVLFTKTNNKRITINYKKINRCLLT